MITGKLKEMIRSINLDGHELEMRTGRADILRPAGRTGIKRAEKPSKMKTS